MSNALNARLTRLEARGDESCKKVIVVGDEAERDALIKAGRHLDGTVVIMTGVLRSAKAG
jgi:hypothetical protein